MSTLFDPAIVGLVILLLLGLAARSPLVATAAALLLVIRLTRLDFLLPILARRGVELGLLFLTLAMLVPFARGTVHVRDIVRSLSTVTGLVALAGGALATLLNGRGLDMLARHSEMIIALIAGSIVGIVVWGGIPVGPLMAAGLAYLMLEIVNLVQRHH
ncbi:MAG: DUF441 domain-containing protein [Actinomycetia bacterium]|jgi:uncharacterized membrane protein (DUF441 family)|nr:DUF441 domain-containing protein [Actinomycetes bacterium]